LEPKSAAMKSDQPLSLTRRILLGLGGIGLAAILLLTIFKPF
jgi:hypothetical protein